jgi:hypothetical protein
VTCRRQCDRLRILTVLDIVSKSLTIPSLTHTKEREPPMTAIEITEKIQGGVLKAVETSQAWTLGALRSTSTAFDAIKLDASAIPFSDKVPSATETLDVTFSFWGKLLDAQRSFLTGVADVYAPTTATPSATAATVTNVTTAKKV